MKVKILLVWKFFQLSVSVIFVHQSCCFCEKWICVIVSLYGFMSFQVGSLCTSSLFSFCLLQLQRINGKKTEIMSILLFCHKSNGPCNTLHEVFNAAGSALPQTFLHSSSNTMFNIKSIKGMFKTLHMVSVMKCCHLQDTKHGANVLCHNCSFWLLSFEMHKCQVDIWKLFSAFEPSCPSQREGVSLLWKVHNGWQWPELSALQSQKPLWSISSTRVCDHNGRDVIRVYKKQENFCKCTWKVKRFAVNSTPPPSDAPLNSRVDCLVFSQITMPRNTL